MAVPQLTKTIDTMHDIYESGLPVEMVDYGDLGPLDMRRSSDPIVRNIHENRVIKEFSPIVQACNNNLNKHYLKYCICLMYRSFFSYKMFTLEMQL